MSEMREILFRGKDLQEQNGWLYGYFYKSDINKRERESGKATLIFTPNCDTFIYCPEYHNSWMVKAETVGRYTGLTDKNSNRIFEGDIVHGNLGNFVVRWSDNISGFVAGEKERTHPCMNRGTMKCYEVIGNIYDNPELIKEAEKI